MQLSQERWNRFHAGVNFLLQTVSDNRFNRGRHSHSHRMKTRRRKRQVLFHDRWNRRALEWNFARKHLVKDHAETVDVSARIRLVVRPLFRSHVERRTHQSTGLGLDKRSE